MSTPTETFFLAWSKTDAEERSALIAQSMAENAIYVDPRSPEPISGLSALSDYVGMFSANAPGWTATVVKSDEVGGMTRATVAFGGMGPDGTEMIQHGQYFVEQADGKITRMVGFVGTGTPE